jgi:predicted dehydrogenase
MRALIIGYGSIGQRHARNFSVLMPDTEIVVLRRDSSQAVQGAVVVSDLRMALGMRPDLAILATPSAAHIDVLVDLILEGIPTYVEKPVVTTSKDVARVREAMVTRPDPGHVTGFNLRLLPSLQLAQDMVRRGVLGELARASFTAGQWLPDWRKTADFRQSYSTRKSDGGGVIFDLSHELDSARFLLGEVCLHHCSTMHLFSLGIEAESAATIVGRADRGSLVSVNVDYVARRPNRRYELVGDEASLVWDWATRRLECHSPAGIEVVTERPEDFDVPATYITALSAFVEGVVARNGMSLQSLEDGLRSTELAIAANKLGATP